MFKQGTIKKAIWLMLVVGINMGVVNFGFARWATQSDAATQTEQGTRHIYVNKDGTYTQTYEVRAKILKEDAKAIWAHYPFQYNADTNKIKILEAKTLVNGKAYPVNTNQIEDKPVASNVNGFDQINQIIIAYPHLAINADVILKYQDINSKTPLPNFYADLFAFGLDGYTKQDNVFIKSELPLYVELNDPDKVLVVKQTTKQENGKNLYLIEIKQNRPFMKQVADEEHVRLNPKYMALASVSSMKTWNSFGTASAIDYDKIRQQPLPELYKEIAAIAQKKKTTIEKINTVTSLLAEKITYLSDRRTIKGSFVPQSLQKVADTRLGDCKDFSMATAVILQSIGIPSKIAFVVRGEGQFPLPVHLPGPGHLNHAIVKVMLPEGVLWVDPTNFVSMASYVFPDIADRKAIVLNADKSDAELIPQVKVGDQRVVRREVWNMKNPSELEAKGTIQFLGSAGRFFAGQKNVASEASIKHGLVQALGDNYGQILGHQVTLPDLSSRIVQDQVFNYILKARNSGLKTNAGRAIPLTFKAVDRFATKKDTVSDVYVGTPATIDSYITIQNIKPAGKHSLDCKIESPWVNIARTVKYENNQVLVHQQMQVKKSWIEGASLESPEYKTSQLAIAQNFNNGIAIIFDPSI